MDVVELVKKRLGSVLICIEQLGLVDGHEGEETDFLVFPNLQAPALLRAEDGSVQDGGCYSKKRYVRSWRFG